MARGKQVETPLSRNKFEAFLRENKPLGYQEYIKVKKIALENGEDPIREFRKVITETEGLGKTVAMNFWLMAIGKRLAIPENDDVVFLREILASNKIDLDMLIDLLGGDQRRIADVICALHLDKLENAGYSSVYMIVDKIIKGKAGRKGTPPPPGKTFFDDIPDELLVGNIDALEILKAYGIEEYQRMYQNNYEAAERQLEEKIRNCKEPGKKIILQSIYDYYSELKKLNIPGIVDETIDKETGGLVGFPAVHQKIGARFIAEKKRTLIADEMGLGKTALAVIAKNLIESEEGRKTAVAVVPNNVLAQWEEQINLWNTERRSVVVITSKNKTEALEQIERERPDFVLVSYDMIFRKHNGGTVANKLETICDYLILDEVHNTKEAKSLRSKGVVGLSRRAEYVTLLSGTPVPNRVEDLGVIASILWNHEFTAKDFNKKFKHNPRVVRERILPRMLRRRKRDTFGEGQCTRHVVAVPMTKQQEQEHKRLELNPDGVGSLELIAQLRRCALDPQLVGISEESPKYQRLVEMLVDHHDDSPAVVFSSELKEGVLDKLVGEIEGYGLRVARIDGDPERSGKHRDRILTEFNEEKYDVVVATLATLGEGIDKLTVSHRGYFIDIPFTEAKLAQGITRLDRKGQKNPVDIYLMVSENSIDELLLRLIDQKRILGEFLIDGMELTDFEKRIIEEGERLVECGTDPLRKLYRFFGATYNRTTESVIRLLGDPVIGRFVAEEYWNNFEGSFYGNMNNLVASVIRGLEGEFGKILDLASGPCCLARALERPVVSLDANAVALEVGKRMLGEKAGETVVGSFTKLPFKEETFDCIAFSLGLLHSAVDEREGIIRQINRAMRKDGVVIITMPSGEGRYDKLAKILPMLGFRVLPDMTGTAQGIDRTDFECTIISAVKVSDPIVDSVPLELFDFQKDKMESEDWEASVSKKVKREECHQFEIDGVSVEDARVTITPPKNESQTARKEFRKLKPSERLGFLIDRYKSLTHVPQKDLDELGIEVVSVGRGNRQYWTVVLKEEAGMNADHKAFVNGRPSSEIEKRQRRAVR
ncbi:methyltransferase domain-containing protein [Candidatus Micrarchaeota archaeon]|nr:methyltransferase domain-containing protein [Candidatus Micrarchaeota archaeon]